MSNHSGSFLTEYGHRWEIESGYKSINWFMAVTTSKNFRLRFFYFAFACLVDYDLASSRFTDPSRSDRRLPAFADSGS